MKGIDVVNARFVANARRIGVPVHVWTINERVEIERLLDLGVDGIMTDETELLRDVMIDAGHGSRCEMTSLRPRSGNTHLRARAPDFPDRPEFYRRVLDRCPTPVVVVDDSGSIVYANEALMELSGYSKVEGVQTSIFDYLHPDDVRLDRRSVPAAGRAAAGRGRMGDRPWSPIHARMIGQRRRDHPGRGPRARHQRRPRGRRRGLRDPSGPRTRDLPTGADRGRRGRRRRDPARPRARTAGRVVARDLRRGARTARWRHGQGHRSDVATSWHNSSNERAAMPVWPASPFDRAPVLTPVEALPGRLGRDLRSAGLVDAWCVDVASPAPRTQHRLVGFTPTHQCRPSVSSTHSTEPPSWHRSSCCDCGPKRSSNMPHDMTS